MLRSEVRNKPKMWIILISLCVLFGQANGACQRPVIKQGFIVPEHTFYGDGASVYYACNPGLKPTLETWWGALVCRGGEWSHKPLCIDINNCMPPDVPNAKPEQPSHEYPNNKKVPFICDKGYDFEHPDLKEGECKDGKWGTLPVCKRQQNACREPSRVENAMIEGPYRDTFEDKEIIQYICKEGYVLEGNGQRICDNTKWSAAPRCVRRDEPSIKPPSPPVRPDDTSIKPPSPPVRPDDPSIKPVFRPVSNCGQFPTVENGVVSEHVDGRSLIVQCARLHIRDGNAQIMCVGGQWSELPVCKAPCKLDRSMLYRSDDEYMEHGETWYQCSFTSRVYIKCVDGRAYYRGCGRNQW